MGDADLTRRRQLPLLSSAVVAFKRGGLGGSASAALVFGEMPQVPAWRTSQRRLREVHNVPVATLIVHGGAGRWDPRIPRAEIDAGLDRALETGWRALDDGALSAVSPRSRTIRTSTPVSERFATLTARSSWTPG
jgi:hypothetical protein